MRPLAEYTRKRNFKITAEPKAKVAKRAKNSPLIFVVQEHHASHLHYDFRLEWEGVLKSWAVPKGPSLDPAQKRLAVEVEDHPKDYATFTGTIPKNQYGAGEVYRWDMGTWIPKKDVNEGLRKGRLEFELKGKKLKGEFVLVRTGRQSSKPNWLLIKRHDEYAEEGAELEPIVADDQKYKTKAKAMAKPKKKVLAKASAKAKAKVKADLEFVPPHLAQLVTQPPKGPDWVHEVKYDGYRIQAHIQNGEVRLYTRRGLNWTEKYSELAKALSKLKDHDVILDGEIVWQDEAGRSDFQKLQNAMKDGSTDELVYWIFDLLYLDGEDLRSLPLIARKDRLEKLVDKVDSALIRYSQHYRGVGEKMIEASCAMDLEGIICKRVDANYVSGRRDDWVKVKCTKRQEFIIGGFTEPEGSRTGFGALLLGIHEDGKLRYVGRCGTGFNNQSLRMMYKKLRQHEVDESPFEVASPRARGLHWIEPKLMCEVSYSEMTKDKILRVPVFKGLRSDKKPEQITLEEAEPVRGDHVVKKVSKKTKTRTTAKEKPGKLPISSPDRVIYTKEKLTKLDVAQYYMAASEWILPHVKDRPLSLVRCPNSSTKPCFFSKHFKTNLPEHLIAVPDKEHEDFIAIDSKEGLLQLAQWGSLEIHPWNCHRDDIEAPDQIVMDFDPHEDLDFDLVKEGALEMRELLKQLGLKSFLKTTGGKGLHVQFPFEPLYDWDTVKSFAKTLTQEMVSRHPDLYTGNMSKKLRSGKIFLDYLRNGRGATAVAPYSLRARAISSVAMPIAWEELEKLPASNIFTLPKAIAYLKKRKKDPWKDYFKTKQKIALLN